jgi:hypothetical protein
MAGHRIVGYLLSTPGPSRCPARAWLGGCGFRWYSYRAIPPAAELVGEPKEIRQGSGTRHCERQRHSTAEQYRTEAEG